ncbi:MAG: hypothetical protein M3Y77_04870 [Actinomycetota bacterium]|nr:hypothetical protein [Actinomycetota bacterium]
MIVDSLLIAVGCALVAVASMAHMRRFHGIKFGPFAPREQRINAQRRNWQVNTLFGAGIVIVVLGGANAQRHYIGYWAMALVFLPMLVTVALLTMVHNRRVELDGSTEAQPVEPTP